MRVRHVAKARLTVGLEGHSDNSTTVAVSVCAPVDVFSRKEGFNRVARNLQNDYVRIEGDISKHTFYSALNAILQHFKQTSPEINFRRCLAIRKAMKLLAPEIPNHHKNKIMGD